MFVWATSMTSCFVYRNHPNRIPLNRPSEPLRQIGALDEKENLTSLGQHLASLPVDVRVGKMLLYGAVLGCLGPVSDDPYATQTQIPNYHPNH